MHVVLWFSLLYMHFWYHILFKAYGQDAFTETTGYAFCVFLITFFSSRIRIHFLAILLQA